MIFSIVEKTSEHGGTQKVIVKGSNFEIATELKYIMIEAIKHGFPEELLLSSLWEAFDDNHKSNRV